MWNGGLGKTTLARKIYHDEGVQSSFDARAWVCATQKFEASSLLHQILKQLLPDHKKKEANDIEPDDMVVQLNDILVERKCLIVIDDIWEIDHWNILKPTFPRNCKVVLTTRNENIVSQECVYKLEFPTEDQGWELLQKTAFLKDDAPVLETRSRSLEDIGRQIVQKCGRLPLAISVIGGILRQKQSLAEWENVSSNIDSYLKHGEGVGNYTGVKQVLDLSYDALPYYLKPCFLYLGCFPEDKKIKPWRLYLLWISEGLISSDDRGSNETLMDVAERYLSELAFRCMVQVQKNTTYTPHDKFESCQLHDLIHDLCSSKAEEEKFFKRIDFNKHPHGIPSSTTISMSRLAICVDYETTTLSINEIQKFEGLRSFMVLVQNLYSMHKIYFQDSTIDFDKSKCLRILVLDGCKFEGRRLPSKVDNKLIHLRYLSLNNSDVEELPPFVYGLPYLQTLDLRVSDRIKLPNVICKMKRLRHLFLRNIDVIGGDKLVLDGLKELETLEKITSNRVRIADVFKLTNLRKLVVDVYDMDSVSTIVHYMSSNQSQSCQTSLCIEYCDFSSEEGTHVLKNMLMSPSLAYLTILQCKISCGLPCYQQGMCKNLVKLTLYRCEIDGDMMEILGKYPSLQALELAGQETVNTKLSFGADSFPELNSLDLNLLQLF